MGPELIPAVFLLAFASSLALLWGRRSPAASALAGGAVAHMAMVAGHNASSLPKGLATLWPVDNMALFAFATAVTSAEFLAALYVLCRLGDPSRALALGLAAYNFPLGLAVATAARSLPVLSPGAQPLMLAGVAGVAAVEAFAAASVASGPTRWSLAAAVAMPLGFLYYHAAPPYAVDLQPRLLSAVLHSLAAAAMVYAMFKNNLAAAGRLGGLSSFKFWALLFGGVMLYAAAEVALLLYHPQVVSLLHI